MPRTAEDRRALAALPPDGTGGGGIRLSALGRYRVNAVSWDDGDVFVTELPLQPVEETLHRLEAVEAAVFVLPGFARDRGTDRTGRRHCPPDGADDGAGRPSRRYCAGTPTPPGH